MGIPTQKEIDIQLFTHIGTISKILQAKGLITAKEYDQMYADTEKEIAKKARGDNP